MCTSLVTLVYKKLSCSVRVYLASHLAYFNMQIIQRLTTQHQQLVTQEKVLAWLHRYSAWVSGAWLVQCARLVSISLSNVDFHFNNLILLFVNVPTQMHSKE